jgi:hypothetical protein
VFGLEIGLFGLIHLILVLWAGLHVIGSSADPLPKAIWLAVLVFLPVLGLIAWFFLGPRAPRKR